MSSYRRSKVERGKSFSPRTVKEYENEEVEASGASTGTSGREAFEGALESSSESVGLGGRAGVSIKRYPFGSAVNSTSEESCEGTSDVFDNL